MTLEQFGRAAEIAKLAAENGLHELSSRAVRESLRPGPPTPTSLLAGGRGGGMVVMPQVVRVARPGQPTDDSAVFIQVEQRLSELDHLWRQHGAPVESVYETLAEAVLPESRPAEIFIYPKPMQGLNEPRSVGRLLARWAVDAGRVDDLKRRIEARQEQPLAQLPAQVLLAQLCSAQGDAKGIAEGLAWLEERLKTDSLANSAELAFHAVPGVKFIEQSSSALSLLEVVANGMAKQVGQGANTENFGQLMLALARARFKQGDADAGTRHVQEYLDTHERQNARYSGDYGVQLRKRQLHQVALEFAEAGQLDATLQVLGQYVDVPRTRQGDQPLGDLMGLVARMLKQLPADERYTRLKQWTLPAEGRRFVRVLAGFVPTDSLWGIEHNASADVANSVTLLLGAARDAGRLEELAAEAKAAAGEPGMENAVAVYLMVEVARGKAAAIESELRTLTDERRKALPNHNDLSRPYAWVDYLLARALSADDRLRPFGEDLTRALVSHGQRVNDLLFVTHCRSDVWACQAAAEPEAGMTRSQDPGLSFWHPAAHQTALTYRAGAPPAWWVAHEGHVAHIAGPQNDFLYFDYPLTGEFEFSVDAYEIHWEEPNISFGGLVFEAIHLGQKTQIWPVGQNETVGISDPLEIPWAFNRLTVRVEPGRNRFYCNGHLVYEDADPSPTSPWLALFSHQYGHTCYRNFAWKGEPQIPREVPLTHGDRMEGWIATFYGETQPPRRTVGRPDNNGRATATLDPNAYDWRADDGVLHGRRRTSDGRPAPAESWLYYHRPLRSGEAIHYEFFYEPDRFEVSPTIGRLAFILNADGVWLHQLTDGTDRPMGGLVRDNLSDEPDHRRGPQRLPLKLRDYNDVTLTLAGDVLTLSLNGIEVYQRPLETDNERFFGLYHDKDRTAAQVRNVVLNGGWPQRLSKEELADSTRLAGEPESDARRRVKHAMLGEDKLALNAGTVWLRARRLPSPERYALLREWVLPNPSHPTFRLRGEFTPVDPAPSVAAAWEPIDAQPAAKNTAQPAAKNTAQPAAKNTARPAAKNAAQRAAKNAAQRAAGNATPTDRHAQVEGKLVAPAIELVAVADELGQIDALDKDISRVVAAGDLDRRGQLALLLLIALARGDEVRAEARLIELCSLVARAAASAPEYQYWPEFVAATAALERPSLRRTARALVESMVQQSIHWYGAPGWSAHIMHLRGKARWLARDEEQQHSFGSELPLAQWRPVTYARAETRGRGYPPSHWRSEGGRLEHVPGHGRDVAYFAVPLAGDFQVDAQFTGFGWRDVELVYDDLREVLRMDLKHLGQSKVGWSLADVEVVPPLEPIGLWFDYRLVVRDGVAASFIGGRKVHERRLPAHPDPWLALSCEGNYEGVARNVRITGNPTVPDVLELSAGHDLSGWRADYYGEVLTGEGLPGAGPAWTKHGDEIVGAKLADVEGSLRESLLQYHRPLLEDGELEYEFFYQPGRAAVHPAFDRLALMIEPDGVRVHWLTDAQFDRTGLTPDNLAVEADNRRGPAALPLRSNEWNRVRLALEGDELTLRLNEVESYRRRLEATNRRFFGLFHYADQTEARVRRLKYRGEWPKALPALDEQELAVEPLRAARFEPNALHERFEWDFRGRPVDAGSFAPDFPFVPADPAKVFFPAPDGLRIALTADQDKTNCAGYKTLFGIHGDFEIELEFTSLSVKPPAAGAQWGSGIELRLQFEGTQDQHLARRCLQPDGGQVLLTCNARRCPGGADDWQFFQNTLDCTSGRFKFVRKGTILYYLFAAGEAEFALYDERTVGKSDVKFCQILALAFDRQSEADVVLKRFSVRAAELSGK